ncbi:SDR family NAD(P)-dependent oxidoreductase [Salinicoccus kekensis]|uniref:3-oxoacyl-[acyl-carrier protein] reductase n=1 Tax=Salinicoccus kekensis TaxID=714307 RepID=A0A285U806_9STAP|nr:SDR family oxidoreductase [Salinicoccus kekensis]SOC38055.1 3-oxoacyl-[acyl-carrier protein] reductase [Salinicoccus kekensis]
MAEKNYLLVGASGDIGRAVHSELEGENVITVSKTRMPHHKSEHHFLDLSRPITEEDVRRITAGAEVLDGLIWTPGVELFGLFQDTSLEALDEQYNISVRSLIIFIKVVLPKLKLSNNGRIIVITSVWGGAGASFESIYSAMKGAQNTLVKSLAKELAATGVTVNAIAPGVVEGSMTDALPDEDLAAVLGELPQQRLIQPAEVASLAAYLLKGGSRSINGEILNINGGWYT